MGNRLILKFYFGADRLNEGLDRLIESLALRQGDTLTQAQRIAEVISFKCDLQKLYIYINSVMTSLTERDRQTLEDFARVKKRFSHLTDEELREVKRALMKLSRHLRGIDRFSATLTAVRKYYSKIYL